MRNLPLFICVAWMHEQPKVPPHQLQNLKRARKHTLEIDTAFASTLSLSLSSTDRVFRQAATK